LALNLENAVTLDGCIRRELAALHTLIALEHVGLAREKWRAPSEEPGGVLWEEGSDRRRSFGVKRCGWH
jgi:hypothetical protein